MKNYLYNVNVYGEKDETTFRTNDVKDALDAFWSAIESGIHCDLLNGFTGEVLAIANHPEGENWCTDETALMMLGWLMAQEWGEDTAPEVAEDDDLLGEPIYPGSSIRCIQCGQPASDPLTELLGGLVKTALTLSEE